MGVIKRLSDIVTADLNSFFDRNDDPDRILDRYMHALDDDMVRVKMEVNTVKSEEKRIRENIAICDKEIANTSAYAERALREGNEHDAKLFLEAKSRMQVKREELVQDLQIAEENTEKMTRIYEKLKGDVNECRDRKDILRSKISVAQSMQRVNDLTGGSPESTMYKINSLEATADRILERQEEEARLLAQELEVMTLKEKYDTASSEEIDAELKALKDKISNE